MATLKSNVNRFFYKNRDRGIRNLMLYLAIGNVIVYLLYQLNQSDPLFYSMLVFDRSRILHGEVWRLFTYPLVFLTDYGLLWGAIGLFFYYWCGSILEQYWGTLRFNCYYLSAIVLLDLAALLLKGQANVYYANLSLFLAVATVMPDQQVRIYFIIPVKMKWLALVDLVLTLVGVISGISDMLKLLSASGRLDLSWLLPLIPIFNYLLFFGKQVLNIMPDFVRYHPTRKSWKRAVKQGRVYDVDPARRPGGARSTGRGDGARFRCTVCGRTELTNPGLEFRYCSKCAGYRCYCEDHIQNHAHITDVK